MATIQKVLREAYTEGKLRNPSYSLRAFARRVGLSPGALSEVLNGKRRVTPQMAQRILPRLNIGPEEAQALIEQAEKGPTWNALTADQYSLLADWTHFAILSLGETKDFRDDDAWIAERLGISTAQVARTIERLEKLGLLARDPKTGRRVPTGAQYSSPDEVANIAVRKVHSDYLEKAREAIVEVDVEQRDFLGVTMAIDPLKLPVAKKRIREVLKDLCVELESGPQTEVYRLGFQLFPLTRVRPSEGHTVQGHETSKENA